MSTGRSEPPARGADQLRSLTRAIGLLRMLAAREGVPARLGQLVEASGMHKSTVHRLVSALVREGFMRHDSEGYSLGVELSVLGEIAARRFDIKDRAMPVLERLARGTGDVALLLLRSGLNVVCVARCEGAAPIIPGTTRVGTVKPLGVGAGSMALLAAMTPAAAEAIVVAGEADRIRNHPKFTTDVVRKELAAARRRGFSVDDQLSTPNVTALGVPIYDIRRHPIAALSYTAFSNRMRPDDQPAMGSRLVAEAEIIAKRVAARIADPGPGS